MTTLHRVAPSGRHYNLGDLDVFSVKTDADAAFLLGQLSIMAAHPHYSGDVGRQALWKLKDEQIRKRFGRSEAAQTELQKLQLELCQLVGSLNNLCDLVANPRTPRAKINQKIAEYRVRWPRPTADDNVRINPGEGDA